MVFTQHVFSLVGLRLCDDAEVGLCQVAGGCWTGGGAAGSPVGGSRTGTLLSNWPLFQRCYYTGTTQRKTPYAIRMDGEIMARCLSILKLRLLLLHHMLLLYMQVPYCKCNCVVF